VESLRRRIVGRSLRKIRIASPFLLRSVAPGAAEIEERSVVQVTRMGKRIVLGLEGDLFIVLHLMIAGRLKWRPSGAGAAGKSALATFDFETGSLLLTEAGSKRRASMHFVRGESDLRRHDPGGLEVLESDLASFQEALTRENHTLKRALTDPRLFSGIGNAYSDEILHRARLSPLQTTGRIDAATTARLRDAGVDTLRTWTERLRAEAGDGFPEKVTAFRKEMAVHGKFGEPCPDCGSPVQRIVYAGNEANYCARCQTGGRLLADRALSRLLKDDWPKTLEELEARSSR
jgi:formamidopyrimidine-DNA glycosylase